MKSKHISQPKGLNCFLLMVFDDDILPKSSMGKTLKLFKKYKDWEFSFISRVLDHLFCMC